MLGALTFLTDREVIVSLAILGAVIATFGTYSLRASKIREILGERNARRIVRSGYFITWISIGFFIVAGFISNY